MALSFGTVSSEIDLLSIGKRTGNFSQNHSDNRHAFSCIQSPLGIIRGGSGPVALICAGNHGDEYEGQIIVRRLFEELTQDDLLGGIILVPALNIPAVLAAQRVSPLDQGNLNRSFPGEAFSSPTKEIAGFVASQLIPHADLVIDLHSGGRTSDYLDSSYFCLTHDTKQNQKTRELAEAMGLPFTFVVPPSDTPGDLDSAAHLAGCGMLSCELGGEGKISRRALNSGWKGVLRVLVRQGIIKEEKAVRLGYSPKSNTQFLDLGRKASYITADSYGLAELLVDIGAEVTIGQPVAIMRDVHHMHAKPLKIVSPRNGIVAVRRTATLIAPGDHLFVIASEYDVSNIV